MPIRVMLADDHTLMRRGLRLIVDVDAAATELLLVIHWKGGVHTELRLPRRRRGQSGSHTSPEIVDAVRPLARICSDDLLAIALNRSGLLTGHGNRWTRERVTALRSHYAIPCYDRHRRESEGWMNLTEAASVLGISPRTLRLAVGLELAILALIPGFDNVGIHQAQGRQRRIR